MLALQNSLLRAFPEEILRSISSRGALVELDKGDQVTCARHRKNVYFPISSVFTVRASVDREANVHLRFVGTDALVGLQNIVTTGDVEYSATVCGAGYAIAVPVTTLVESIIPPQELPPLRARTMGVVARMGMLNAHCAATHSSVQRIARLLIEATRAFGTGVHLPFTHSEIAESLAIRRETVSEQLARFYYARYLETGRERIRVIDEPGLAGAACECAQKMFATQASWVQAWKAVRWTRRGAGSPTPQARSGAT